MNKNGWNTSIWKQQMSRPLHIDDMKQQNNTNVIKHFL